MNLDALIAETDGMVNARRNVHIGAWAADRLGLTGEAERVNYVRAVMDADRELPGPLDVVAKIQGDLAAVGISVTAPFLLAKIRQYEHAARLRFSGAD